jgi:hypothetical protein
MKAFLDALDAEAVDAENALDSETAINATSSFNSSMDPFDSISQTLPPSYSRNTTLPTRSWVFEYFIVTVLEGQFYIPKHSNIRKPERRFPCKHCNFCVLDSKRNGTYSYRRRASAYTPPKSNLQDSKREIQGAPTLYENPLKLRHHHPSLSYSRSTWDGIAASRDG